MDSPQGQTSNGRSTATGALARFAIGNKLVVTLAVAAAVLAGLYTAPFAWDLGFERSPVPVDAIPDIGENQQVVLTEWAGRSPRDVDDQITYPLSAALQGVAGVRTIRSFSAFGFSMIYLVFAEDVSFRDARARIIERLSSLPPNTLPDGVAAQLGPDATPLGQVFWYTLEGRDAEGEPVGGWDLHELRTIQDYQVRYTLAAADGVAEVASIGGFVREYQIDVDPAALRATGVTVGDVAEAAIGANAEVGARELEMNGVEYLVRGVGFTRSIADLEAAVVHTEGDVPLRIRDVARVSLGPAQRLGVLDRGGAEAVGGIVVARYGANPLEVIQAVRAAVDALQPSLPMRSLPDGRTSQVTIVPIYDRSELIAATLGTLEAALTQQVLVTILVVLVMMLHLRASFLISGLLPLAVLCTFVTMKVGGVEANVVALAGIAIAIGTLVDIAIVITENIVRRVEEAEANGAPFDRAEVISEAVGEVGGAVLTAIATTVISFLPVFLLTGPEGKLFSPLAFTKTAALVVSVIIGLVCIPAAAHTLLRRRRNRGTVRDATDAAIVVAGVIAAFVVTPWAIGVLVAAWGVASIVSRRVAALGWAPKAVRWLATALAIGAVVVLLAHAWLPLGASATESANIAFVAILVASMLGAFRIFEAVYGPLLTWALEHKLLAMSVPLAVLLVGALSWLGFDRVAAPLPERARESGAAERLREAFPGLGREFMPQLDEGAFLYMPSAMPHASIGETLAMVQQLDRAIESVPEVERAIGKVGRAESALDPAPVSMIETLIQYAPEYRLDAHGRRIRYAVDDDGSWVRDEDGDLVPDPRGQPYRNWRPQIRRADDIWNEIVHAAEVPGLTSAPLLQPISTRIVMLQSGIRAPMAVRLRGPDLESLAAAATAVEAIVREVPTVMPGAVNADRPVGKPYMEVHPDREALARYGVTMRTFQELLETAVGGRVLTTTVEGRERYPVRVRYPRELRDSPDALAEVLVPTALGVQVPLGELATIVYVRGPEMIRSEDAWLVTYVMFDRQRDLAELQVVESVREALDEAIADGRLVLGEGVSMTFAGTYENSMRAEQRLKLLMPLVLLTIFVLLHLQLRSTATALMVFAGIAVALSGGFILLWAMAQPTFLDFGLFGANMRDVFQVRPINLSIAVWVGFIALFGIATDDGVVMATYLKQSMTEGDAPRTREGVRARVVAGGLRRVRPCLMTTATTILALLPILTSYGTGADVMIPMAIPAVGGMTVALITLFVVPVLFGATEEWKLRLSQMTQFPTDGAESASVDPPPTEESR